MIRTLARCPSVMPPPGACVLAPAATRSSRGEPAATAATALRCLRAPARALLVAAIIVVTSLGLTRPTAARAAVATATAASARKLRLNAWHYAWHQDGKPYLWGGTGPYGFDCSGLVYAAFRSRGVQLPRTTYGMLHSRHLIRIWKSQARRGDLAFYGSGHVEFYYRGNWTFGAADPGSLIGFHRMNRFWHPTMYFRVRR